MRLAPNTGLRLAAVAAGLAMLIVAAIEVGRDRRTPTPAPEMVTSREGSSSPDESLADLIAMCRSLTPEEARTDTMCRQAWAAKRRLFFGSPNPPSERPVRHIPIPRNASQQSRPSSGSPQLAPSAERTGIDDGFRD